jgi:branched-subunit amino acid permease
MKNGVFWVVTPCGWVFTRATRRNNPEDTILHLHQFHWNRLLLGSNWVPISQKTAFLLISSPSETGKAMTRTAHYNSWALFRLSSRLSFRKLCAHSVVRTHTSPVLLAPLPALILLISLLVTSFDLLQSPWRPLCVCFLSPVTDLYLGHGSVFDH